MNLEKQVCSLELAKKLKSLGVKQNSLFYWRLNYTWSEKFENGISLGKKGEFGDYEIQYRPKPRFTTADIKWNEKDLQKLDETEISAFTATELGEYLLNCDFTTDIRLYGYNRGWISFNRDNPIFMEERFSDNNVNEADARAKMLIYLLENKLIKI